MNDAETRAEVSVEPLAVPGAPVVFRIRGDHPDEEGTVHVGGVFDAVEDALEALEVEPAPPPTPGGPAPGERVRSNPVAEARAQGYELHVEQLVPTRTAKDDAGQEVAVESEWKRVS